MNIHHLLVYIFALLVSAGSAWAIGRYGYKLGLLDQPKPRSSHLKSTPKGGGVGILAAFVFTSVVLRLPASFWVAGACVSISGLVADRFDISPAFRLISQFMASAIFLIPFWHDSIFVSGSLFIMAPLTIFMVATANYYNFMDGINGIAGISGIVGFAFLSIYGYLTGASEALITLSAALSISCLGFLPFNFPKAKVFMGDVGSILLGFVFAALAIRLATSLSDFASISLFLFPFYADEITTELVRLKEGEKLWVAHRRHLYQLFANEFSIAHWKVSLSYGIIQLFIGSSALFMVRTGVGSLAVCAIVILYFIIFFSVSTLVRRKVIAQ